MENRFQSTLLEGRLNYVSIFSIDNDKILSHGSSPGANISLKTFSKPANDSKLEIHRDSRAQKTKTKNDVADIPNGPPKPPGHSLRDLDGPPAHSLPLYPQCDQQAAGRNLPELPSQLLFLPLFGC